MTVCTCGHARDWHSHDGRGDCEHDGDCPCVSFTDFEYHARTFVHARAFVRALDKYEAGLLAWNDVAPFLNALRLALDDSPLTKEGPST